MLQQICEHIHNFFEKSTYSGDYSISNGMITPLPPIKEGQRFRIEGSDLNDGVYTYHNTSIGNDDDDTVAGLSNEDFNGSIYLMAIPSMVIELVSDIREWVDKFSVVTESPFQSESFNGYSYSFKSNSGVNADGSPIMSWQNNFASRLNKWRKTGLL